MLSLLRVKSVVLVAMLCLLFPCGTTMAKKTDKSITLYVNQTITLSSIKIKPSKATDKIIWKPLIRKLRR